MSNVNVQGNSPNSQSVAPQYGAHQSLGGTSQFTPGLSGTTTAALLEVMTDMMLISILYGEQMLKQVNAQKDMGEAINICDQKQGDAMFTQALEQGITQMAGGALTAGVGLYSMSSPPTGEIDAQLAGAKSYQKLVNDPPQPNGIVHDNGDVELSPLSREGQEENIASRLKTLKEEPQFSKAGKAVNAEDEKVGDLSDKDIISLLHDDELADLKESIDTNVKDLTDQRQTIMKMHSEKATTFTNIANGFSSAAQGFGTSLSAPQQKEQKDLEGQSAVLQSALNIGQGNSGQQRGGVDKFIGEVGSLTQIMAAISNANALAS